MSNQTLNSLISRLIEDASVLPSSSQQLNSMRRTVVEAFSVGGSHARDPKHPQSAHDLSTLQDAAEIAERVRAGIGECLGRALPQATAAQIICGTAAIFLGRECLVKLHQLLREGMSEGQRPRQSTEAFLVTVEAELLAAELRARDLWQSIGSALDASGVAAEVWTLARIVAREVLDAVVSVRASEPLAAGRSAPVEELLDAVAGQLTIVLHLAAPSISVDATERISGDLGIEPAPNP